MEVCDGGVWTHIAGVYDADSHTMSLYVKGVYSAGAVNPTPQYDANAPLTIGAVVTDGSTTPYNAFKGSVSDVRVYGAALTAGQIAATAHS